VYRLSLTTIKRSHCSSNKKNKLKLQSAVNNQNTEDDLKILLWIPLLKTVSQLLLYFIPMTNNGIPGNRLRQSEYDLQKKVESFGDLIFRLEEQHLPHMSAVVIHYMHLDSMSFRVQWYLSTELLRCEEFSKDHLFPNEAWSICNKATSITGEGWIGLLLRKVKRLSLRI